MGPEGVAWGAACDKRESRATVTAPWPVPGGACWSLIGRIGTGRPFVVGHSVRLSAHDSGQLELGINDNYLVDNAGSWKATVFVIPSAAASPSSTASSHSSSGVLLFVIVAIVGLGIVAGLVVFARRSRAKGAREEEAMTEAVAVAVAAKPPVARATRLTPTDDDDTVIRGQHDATKVNIFDVALATDTLRIGYNQFPAERRGRVDNP